MHHETASRTAGSDVTLCVMLKRMKSARVEVLETFSKSPWSTSVV